MAWRPLTHTSAVQAPSAQASGPQPPAPGQVKVTFTSLPIQLEGEPNGTTAVNPCGCVPAGAITASVVDGTCF